MKKPPDDFDSSWFNFEFSKSINFPLKTESQFPIKECLNSEKYLLKNDFTGFDKVIPKNINNSYIKSDKILLRFTSSQRDKIFKWLKECDKVYNYCVNDFNRNSHSWFKRTYCNYKVYKVDVFKAIYRENKKKAPYDVLTDEVRVFCSNIKSCETKLKDKIIKSYTISRRNHNRQTKSILISKKAINDNGIFCRLLGKNNDIHKYIKNKTVLDSRMIYDLTKNTFTLNLVTRNDEIKNTEKKHFISLDPGENTFCSYFASDSYGYFGKELYKIYLEKRNKISKLQHMLAKYKIRNKNKIKKRIRTLFKKIKNITKELHNKLALYLCKNYKIILLPKFETHKMVKSNKKEIKKVIAEIKTTNNNKELLQEKLKNLKELNKKSRLNSKMKYTLNMMSHYKFKQHLINKADEYGCLVEIVTEEYTSVTCSKCGSQSKIYNERVKQCMKCKYEINRDINGSINIFHKNRDYILKKRRKAFGTI